MTWLRDALIADSMGLALLHGQAFFVLGIYILFLARRGNRLEVARDLVPLAVFGFCEALVAWSPMWAGPTSPSTPFLAGVRVLLLGLGYAFLFSFALQIFLPSEKREWGRWVLAGAFFVLWAAGLTVALLNGVSADRVWLGGEIAARYGMALPGGLLGAWGLRLETYRTMKSHRLPLVKFPLRISGFALGFFALFGGLLGPAAPFFPARLVNQEVLLSTMGIPISLLRGLCGFAVTFGVVRALGAVLNEMELWLEDVEHMQALMSERERIGRELHDGIIQSIYASGLMLEGVQQSLVDDPEKAHGQLARVITSLNRTIQDIRRYIFDLRGELPEDDLETGLRKLLRDFRVNTLLETAFIVEGEDSWRIGPERRQHVFQIAREALTNVARHAQARRVEMSLHYGPQALQIRISDDGVGLSAQPGGDGQGLRNIRERTNLLGGMLDVNTAPNEGLTLTLTVPY